MNGRHALVTGGGTGIGLAIARALLEAGARVTVTGRRTDVLRSVDGATPVAMDVADEASVVDGVARARDANGPVAVCVANAGVAEGASLRKTEAAFWRRIMATNLDGCFHTARACVPDMLEGGWGRFIAVSSIAGIKGLKGAAAYAASKHGVIGLTRTLAIDHIGSGVTFNAICPGYVETDIVSQNLTRIMERTGKSEAEAMAVMRGANPHGRLIAPEEVAACAMWLVSDAAGSVNGQAVQVSGGEV